MKYGYSAAAGINGPARLLKIKIFTIHISLFGIVGQRSRGAAILGRQDDSKVEIYSNTTSNSLICLNQIMNINQLVVSRLTAASSSFPDINKVVWYAVV